MPVLVRKGNPQLESSGHRNFFHQWTGPGPGSGRKDGELGMGDAMACRHDVQLAGPDHYIAAYAVAVPYGASRGGHVTV